MNTVRSNLMDPHRLRARRGARGLIPSSLARRPSTGQAGSLPAAPAPHFTVFAYDRRGRGDSGDTSPYAPQRQIEDIDALIGEAGRSAFVYGHSSGAALALEAAVRGLPISKLALDELPYIGDVQRLPQPDHFLPRLRGLVAAGRRADGQLLRREGLQLLPEAIIGMRAAPWLPASRPWHTIPYDIAVLGDHMAGQPLPAEWATRVTMPALVLDGAESPAQLRNACVVAVTACLPHAKRRTSRARAMALPEVLVPCSSRSSQPETSAGGVTRMEWHIILGHGAAGTAASMAPWVEGFPTHHLSAQAVSISRAGGPRRRSRHSSRQSARSRTWCSEAIRSGARAS